MQSHTDTNLVETENWDPSLDFIIKQMNGAPLNVHKLLVRLEYQFLD